MSNDKPKVTLTIELAQRLVGKQPLQSIKRNQKSTRLPTYLSTCLLACLDEWVFIVELKSFDQTQILAAETFFRGKSEFDSLDSSDSRSAETSRRRYNLVWISIQSTKRIIVSSNYERELARESRHRIVDVSFWRIKLTQTWPNRERFHFRSILPNVVETILHNAHTWLVILPRWHFIWILCWLL